MSILTTTIAYRAALMRDMAQPAAASAYQCQRAVFAQVELITAHVVARSGGNGESVRYDVEVDFTEVGQLRYVPLAGFADVDGWQDGSSGTCGQVGCYEDWCE